MNESHDPLGHIYTYVTLSLIGHQATELPRLNHTMTGSLNYFALPTDGLTAISMLTVQLANVVATGFQSPCCQYRERSRVGDPV